MVFAGIFYFGGGGGAAVRSGDGGVERGLMPPLRGSRRADLRTQPLRAGLNCGAPPALGFAAPVACSALR
jgi:hypothetical protein